MMTFRPSPRATTPMVTTFKPSPPISPQAEQEVERKAARWQARRAGKARWGPVTPAQRLIWRDKGL